jgi:dTDP-4-dehydrorhamnose reductase
MNRGCERQADARPILVLGASGMLGQAFGRRCSARGVPCRLLARDELDLSRRSSIDAVLDRTPAWAVVNAAGYARVDDAQRDLDACWVANVTGPVTLAEGCRRRNLSLITFSSDLVFDGARTDAPYTERDAPAPLGLYGWSKAEMESRVKAILPSALIVRTSSLFGPWDEKNFVTHGLARLRAGETVVAADDVTMSATYLPDLVDAALDLLLDGESGLWHLANRGAVSCSGLLLRAAELAGVRTGRVQPRPQRELGLAAKRPPFSVLATERGRLLPLLDDALSRYVQERTAQRESARTAA